LWKRNAQVRQKNENNRNLRNLKNLGAEFSEAANTEEAEEILAWQSSAYVDAIEQWVPREKCKDPTQWHKEVGKFLSNLKSEDPLEGPDLFAAIVNPDLLESEIARSDRLDEAIDRKIKRLMQVKTAKQVFPGMRKNARPEPKLVNAPAGANAQPTGISEGQPKLAEIVVCEKSNQERSTVATPNNVVIEGTRTDEDTFVSASPDVVKKEHPDKIPVKVDFSAKPRPTVEEIEIDELNRFSALCNSAMNSNTSSNPSSSPGPA
jgi:hypothetical protein